MMKPFVAKSLFGAMFCCLIFNNSAWANPSEKQELRSTKQAFLSAKVLTNNYFPILPLELIPNSNYLNYSLSAKDLGYVNTIIDLDKWYTNQNSLSSNVILNDPKRLSLDKIPFAHQTPQGNFVLGVQNTFWPSNNNGKYWGLTATKSWGNNSPTNQANHNFQPQNNPNNLPSLAKGTSSLIMSGGGQRNMGQKTDSWGEFKEFRGGLAFQQGVSQDLTLGVGMVYENLLSGFSQLSYRPTNFPLKTSVAFMTGKEGLEFQSHLKFKPAENFVLNFHSDRQRQKFDLTWGMGSGLTVTAKGNSQDHSLAAGVNLAVKNDYFSLKAIAGLDNNDNWQWNITSQVDRWKLTYASNSFKSNSELSYDLFQLQDAGLVCSLFVNYETRQKKNSEEYLTVGGWRIQSGEKLGSHKNSWEFNFGYGVGSQGTGIIASTSTAISPHLFLKLSLQEVSVVSDELHFKLELTK